MTAPLLQLHAVEKSFSGTRALRPLTLSLDLGEVLGLIGENGAGKSTLIKILSGVQAPDGGTIQWQGRTVRFASPHQAMQAGIATIHQELAYCGHLTVAENLLLGEPWPRHRWGGVDWNRLHAEAAARLQRCQLDIATNRAFAGLSTAQKQEAAIARALARQVRLLILDEPTASLSGPEVERLFRHLRKLRTDGVAILYVSHRLDEILQLAGRVAVLRDGELAASYPAAGATMNRMVKDMVGRPLDQVYPRTRRSPQFHGSLPAPVAAVESAAPLLELEGVSRGGMFRDIHLALRAGEILGLAGLVGAGRSELARAVYGLYPCESGVMRLRGKPWAPRRPDDSLAAGLVYLPEERKRQGLVAGHSVSDSISIGFTDLLTRWGMIRGGEERARVANAMQAHDVRATSPDQAIGTLSGGNQQKAILARWLERKPDVIILDEPTRGVDVGAKAEIHQLMDKLAAGGRGVLLISSDLPEILGMSDRILVLHAGTIAAELHGPAMTQENVLQAASGLRPSSI